jgi:hypothetical protein
MFPNLKRKGGAVELGKKMVPPGGENILCSRYSAAGKVVAVLLSLPFQDGLMGYNGYSQPLHNASLKEG